MRLFLDATASLIASATEQPTMLVVEDVHWADEATADLVRHLVLSAIHEASVAGLPLAAMLTARGAWARDAPRALTRLAREGSAVELHLEHFEVSEVHAYVRALTGARAESAMAVAALDATSGNPLLLRGVLERNLHAGTLSVADGFVTLAAAGALSAPTDLDDGVRHELAKADQPTRSLLALAAVVGDGALESSLRASADPELDVDAAVTRGVELGLIELDGSRIRFSHPQIRHVLYEGLDPSTKAKAHLRVADALEVEGGPALAVAHHLRHSGVDPTGERLARWTLRAGDEAWSSGAWVDALESYSFALRGVGRDSLEGNELTEALLRTGIAAYYANHDSCSRWLDEAARAAEAQGDARRRAEALLLRARFALVATAATVGATPPSEDLEALLPTLDADPALRARVLATISDLAFVGLDHPRAAEYARRAEAVIGDGIDDDATVARVHFVLGLQDMSSMAFQSAVEHFSAARALGDDHLRLAAATRAGLCLLALGQLDAAAELLTAARLGERALSSHAGQQLPTAGLAALAVLRGDLGGAETLTAEVTSLYSIQEYAFTPGMAYPAILAARLARGDDLGADRAIREWESSGGRGVWRYATLLRAVRGETEAVTRELRARPWPPVDSRDLFTLDVPCLHVAVGSATGDSDLVRRGLPALKAAHEQGLVFTPGWPWCVSRVIGDGHAALGDLEAARRWYQRAQAETSADTAPVEHALILLGQARVEVDAGNRTRAAEHAASSAAMLDSLGLVRLSSQASELLDRIDGAPAPTPRDRFILFTDIVGSTALNVRSGDEGYIPLIEEHDRILRARFQQHDGVEHAHTGDGMSAWFSSAEEALWCAFGIRSDLERASINHAELPVRVRIGLSAGRPIHTEERLFGLAVVTSSRVCALAGPDQVFVTDAVRAAAPGSCTFREVGQQTLKGLPGTHLILEAVGFAEG
jgi:class 3 adenylate cyclase